MNIITMRMNLCTSFIFSSISLKFPGILKNGHAIHVKRLMQTKLKGLLAMKM